MYENIPKFARKSLDRNTFLEDFLSESIQINEVTIIMLTQKFIPSNTPRQVTIL